MTVRVSHIVGAFLVIVVLLGAAFSFGKSLSGTGENTAETAAAASTVEGATTSEELSEENADREMYEVVKIVDGDTIAISINGKSETVRLIGIDTPETVDTRVEVQCFGKESANKMKSLLSGRKVYFEIDEGEGERDKYKRLLAYIFRDDGLFINKHMIAEGYAYEYTYDTDYKYQDAFKNAEVSAKAAQKGLWKPNACPTPTVKGAATVPAPVPKAVEPAPAVQPTPTTTPQTAPVEQSAEVKKEESKPEPEEEPEPAAPASGIYTCSSNKYNCTDFKTHAEAQAVYDQCGGVDNDVHKLDNNKDGEACESLP